MDDLFAFTRRQAVMPVDVLATRDDSELDDHLSVRLGSLVGEDVVAVAAMSEDLRAYYVTRFFEREYGSGGVTGLLDWGAAVGPLVTEGYRRLGLNEPAMAFDALWSLPALQRLASDETYEPTDGEEAEFQHRAEAVGWHDHERIAFIRSHPEVFSI
jgi:hypothetical protein